MADTWLRSIPGIREQEPLSRHSWYAIGGPAEYYLEVSDAQQLALVLERARENGTVCTVFGAGSNTLFPDEGLNGLTLKVAVEHFKSADGVVTAGAGTLMPWLALETAKRGLAGLEFGAGVPGTVGGSVFGNAGAFGVEVRDRLLSAECLDASGKQCTVDAVACAFAYRDSAFKSGALRGHVVVAASFTVFPGDPLAIREQIRQVQRHRRETQPIDRRSLGSTFKNPPGDAAGRLIDACGLKGRRIGGAQISEKHANFIVNLGGARAGDVLALMAEMQARVRDQFGIELEAEVRVIGRGAPAA